MVIPDGEEDKVKDAKETREEEEHPGKKNYFAWKISFMFSL